MSKKDFFQPQKYYDNLIIDVNNWYYRNYEIHKNLTVEIDGKHLITGGVWGFLQSLKRFKREFLKQGGRIYCLFDNADSKKNMRQQLYDPTYKVSRKKKSDSFYRGLDYLRLILMNYGENISVVYGTGFEADDLLPPVLNSINEKESSLIISEDLDWSRGIYYKKRDVAQYMGKKVYDRKLFNERFNFMPSESSVVLYKVIRGDKADEIPIGIKNFPSKKLEQLIGDYKDIFEVLANIDIIPYLTDRWKQEFKERSARLRLNHQLVAFIPISESYIKEFTTNSKFKPRNLALLYEGLAFDIEKIDPRLFRHIDRKDNSKVSQHYKPSPPQKAFEFRPPKIERS